MDFFSKRINIEILAICVGVIILLIIWFRRRIFRVTKWAAVPPPPLPLPPPLSLPPTIKEIEEGINFHSESTKSMAVANEDSFFLSADNVSVIDKILSEFHDDGVEDYNPRDKVWLNTWQTRIHRPSSFAKSVMAIVLPESDGKYDDMTMRSLTTPSRFGDTDCDKEMLVIPANMTAGMCDHNLALGMFLWSPGKQGLQDLKGVDRTKTISASIHDKYDTRSPLASMKVKTVNHHQFQTCPCGATHRPVSPLTAPASEIISALSSVKSTSSQTNRAKHTQRESTGINSHSVERGIPTITGGAKHLRNCRSHNSGQSTPRVSSSSSSSASALSPPPPSASSYSYLVPTATENYGGRMHYDNTNFLKYKQKPHSLSSFSSPTTQDWSSPNPFFSKGRDNLQTPSTESIRKHEQNDTHFRSPYAMDGEGGRTNY